VFESEEFIFNFSYKVIIKTIKAKRRTGNLIEKMEMISKSITLNYVGIWGSECFCDNVTEDDGKKFYPLIIQLVLIDFFSYAYTFINIFW